MQRTGGDTSQESVTGSAFVEDVVTDTQQETRLDVESRRQLLFPARMRFSSETQCIRRQAVDHIIEQNLALSDVDAGLSVREIQEQRVVALPDGTSVLTRDELDAGLRRLVSSGRVIASVDEPTKYKVSDHVRTEIWQLQANCERWLST